MSNLPEWLRPKPLPIIVEGPVVYTERTRSKSMIILRKEIRQELSGLEDRKADISYQIAYFRNDGAAFEQYINEILQSNRGIPLLLYLYKGKPQQEQSSAPIERRRAPVDIEAHDAPAVDLIVERKNGKLSLKRVK